MPTATSAPGPGRAGYDVLFYFWCFELFTECSVGNVAKHPLEFDATSSTNSLKSSSKIVEKRSWAVLGAPGGAERILSHPRLGPFTVFKGGKEEQKMKIQITSMRNFWIILDNVLGTARPYDRTRWRFSEFC